MKLHLLRSLAAVVGIVAVFALILACGVMSAHPAHSSGPVPVSITNTALPVTSTDSPGANPFYRSVSFNLSGYSAASQFIVPAGERLVITYMSTDFVISSVKTPSVVLTVTTKSNGQTSPAKFPVLNAGDFDGYEEYLANDSPTIYADPGATVYFAVDSSEELDEADIDISVYGYLVKDSAAVS